MTGYTADEHYANPDLGLQIVHTDDRGKLADIASGKIDPRQPLTLRWVRKDGRVIWTEQRNIPITDASGRVVALQGIARDITERIMTEEKLPRERKVPPDHHRHRAGVRQDAGTGRLAPHDEPGRAGHDRCGLVRTGPGQTGIRPDPPRSPAEVRRPHGQRVRRKERDPRLRSERAQGPFGLARDPCRSAPQRQERDHRGPRHHPGHHRTEEGRGIAEAVGGALPRSGRDIAGPDLAMRCPGSVCRI